MFARKMLLCLAIATGSVVFPAMSQARVDLNIDIGPPPAPHVEEVPPPRHGYVWAPGYWTWEGHRHVWMEGHWMRARPGYRWVPDRWEQRDNHWSREVGHWEHDPVYHEREGHAQEYHNEQRDHEDHDHGEHR